MHLSRSVLTFFLTMFFLSACNNNLLPSDEDKRQAPEAGSEGSQPTQKLADFTLKDIDGNDRTLSEFLQNGDSASDAVVIYFTMWCSTCMAHTDHLENSIMPSYADKGKVTYLLIDYVTRDVDASAASASANGVANSDFIVLVDDGSVRDQLGGNMAVALVVDSTGVVFMNQDFGSGTQLEKALSSVLGE